MKENCCSLYAGDAQCDSAAMGLRIAASIGKAWGLFASHDGKFRSVMSSHAVTGGVQHHRQGCKRVFHAPHND